MKSGLAIILTLVVAGTVAGQTFYGSTDVTAFREGRDREMRSKSESPLLPEDLKVFAGLEYFPVAEKFAVRATLEKLPGKQRFVMPTSAGISRSFGKYGALRFEIDGKPYELTVFEPEGVPANSEFAGLLFVPFRDLTNGTETYGGGRYIDIWKPAGSEVVVNFNVAYNPSCAYGSDRFSCPLPPRENFLQIKITAGEKIFKHAVKN